METINSRNKSILGGPGIREVKEDAKGRPGEAEERLDECWVIECREGEDRVQGHGM